MFDVQSRPVRVVGLGPGCLGSRREFNGSRTALGVGQRMSRPHTRTPGDCMRDGRRYSEPVQAAAHKVKRQGSVDPWGLRSSKGPCAVRHSTLSAVAGRSCGLPAGGRVNKRNRCQWAGSGLRPYEVAPEVGGRSVAALGCSDPGAGQQPPGHATAGAAPGWALAGRDATWPSPSAARIAK